jgi:hypothetical protein
MGQVRAARRRAHPAPRVRRPPPQNHDDVTLREWDELGYDQSVLDLVFHANAERVPGL